MRKLKPMYASTGIATPSVSDVQYYLGLYASPQNAHYRKQDQCIHSIITAHPHNVNLDDVLAKACLINEFYSTNIFKILPVAENILTVNFDKRIKKLDCQLVADVAKVNVGNGKILNLYSFATKYCANHNPNVYPIFDSYVEGVLVYFRDKHFHNKHQFASFKNSELRDYKQFCNIIDKFRTDFGLTQFSVREIDHYLWMLGKDKFE